MKLGIYIVLSLIAMQSVCAQENLVKNPSFETYNRCPDDQNRIRLVLNWNVPFFGTPDYFNRCSVQKNAHHHVIAGVPDNLWGYQEPRTGDAYVGIFATYQKNDLFGEYVQGDLIKPLIKGKEYYIEYWVNMADKFNRGTNAFSAYLSKVYIRMNKAHDGQYHANMHNEQDEIITDKVEWHKISGRYVASGGEKYILVGNFLDRREIKFSERLDPASRDKSYATYYYVDDVMVTPYEEYIALKAEKKTDKIVKPQVLKNVQFETDKFELLETSFKALDDLVTYLTINPNVNIEIMGHTDAIGDVKTNKILSANRAKAVLEYLVAKGIKVERLSSHGYGGTKPIADNETPQGRAKNRRVEIKVVI